MNKLKKRWGVTTNYQLTIIFMVFAITGSASAWLSKPLCVWIGITKETLSWGYYPLRFLLVFPIYQFLLVLIGFVFGQFQFFWNFEKKMLRRLGLGFLLKD